jgi:membrane protease YdiL (CAAX protease family)
MHWDFALILVVLGVAVPWLGRRRIRLLMREPETGKADRLALYASTVASQWFAAAVVLWRARVHGISPSQLGIAAPSVGLTTAVAILLAALLLANQVLSLRRLAAHPEEIRGVLPKLAIRIFPQDAGERLVFLAVVATVAICEELIYRGFVQRVFTDWWGGAMPAGIIGSAVLFSWAHLYQGRRGLASTFLVGLLFSAVRAWTGSLAPPVVSHFVADLAVGLLAPARFQKALAQLDRESRDSGLDKAADINMLLHM